MTKITIEVDGKNLEAEAGEMLIQVTDRNDIYIPRFCYHEKLSIAANCRMCLVEVEKSPKPLPACATPCMDGMKVFTKSAVAKGAQKDTMEFLLINHPLDCPVCDQGGECPLQDQAMGYGGDDSRYVELKRSVPSHDIGPLVATEMTRCIHCTRCVRFGEEVAGVVEMGAPGRGEHMKISTFLNRSIDSEVSGNIIDLCPVGALTSKPYRFAARSWELQNHASISPHDCLGSNINIQTLRGEVERVLPIENKEINECWLADRDRFSYEAVNSEQRLTKPMIKKNGKWKKTDWKSALNFAADGLKNISSASKIGGLAAATSTLEEFYLFQKLFRGLGSENIDHRLQQCDFRDDAIAPQFPGSEFPITKFSELDSVLLVGSNIRKEQPLLALRLRDNQKRNNISIFAINPMGFDFNFNADQSLSGNDHNMVNTLANVAASIAKIKSVDLPNGIKAVSNSNSDTEHIANNIIDTGNSGGIVIGALAQQHMDASLIKAICHWISENTECGLSILPPANSAAGWLAKCLPGGGGLNAGQMLGQNKSKGLKGYVLLGTEPELDSIDGKSALKALNNAGFVVQISAFKSDSVSGYVDVVLPMAAFTESAGTFINCEGKSQFANVAAAPKEEARPAWKILRVLGNFLEIDGFDYVTLDDVKNEITSTIDLENLAPSSKLSEWEIGSPLTSDEEGMSRLLDMPMYRGDVTLRNASALQRTADNPPPTAVMNTDTASKLNLKNGDDVSIKNGSGEADLKLRIDNQIPNDNVYVPAGFKETANLGGHITVKVRIP